MKTKDVIPGKCPPKAEHSNAIQRSMLALFMVLLTIIPGIPAGAQDIPSPPYYISRGEYVVIGIAYDESRIKKLVPAGLQMAPGATGIIVMYTAGESYGLPAFS